MDNLQNLENKLECNFCGKGQDKVQKIVAGPGVYICDECTMLAYDIVVKELSKISEQNEINGIKTESLTPLEIKRIFDDYVIGQVDAKISLAIAVYNHYVRINQKTNDENDESDVEIQKSNIGVIGPTGSGKTLLAQTIARILDVPFAIADATALTEAGYVGEDVENILLKLVQDADWDIEKAEKGIIYIDEIDKVTRKGENVSITRDVSGEGVQQALLKIIEGTVANIPPQGGRKHPNQEFIQLDTKNILFIVGGAFDGLEEIIKNRINKKGVLGFNVQEEAENTKIDDKTIFTNVLPEDVMKYGLIPEFVGRIPVIVGLEQLDEDALMSILTEPKNALVKQYQELFKKYKVPSNRPDGEDLRPNGVQLDFEKEALRLIAKTAIERKTGARGLRSIIEAILKPLMFRLPSEIEVQKVIITEKYVQTQNEEDLVVELNKKIA